MLLISATMDGNGPYMFEIPKAVGAIKKMELIYSMFERGRSQGHIINIKYRVSCTGRNHLLIVST